MAPALFDVFLCYNSTDKPIVVEINERLKERNVATWLDLERLRPGLPWQEALERQIADIRSAAVFIGKDGRGPWQDLEVKAFLREFVARSCPVIPVVLPGVTAIPDIPRLLTAMTWVDFRVKTPDPLDRLIWGITGKLPRKRSGTPSPNGSLWQRRGKNA